VAGIAKMVLPHLMKDFAKVPEETLSMGIRFLRDRLTIVVGETPPE
jgi:hypothetical protein